MREECLLREHLGAGFFYVIRRFVLRQVDTAVQRHTDFRGQLGAAAQHANRLAVGQQHIFCQRRQLVHHHGGLLLHQAFKRRVRPRKVAVADEGRRLIYSEPEPHPVGQGIRHYTGVVGEIITDFRIVPAAFFVRPHGQIPVENRHHRLNARCFQFVHQVAVKGKTLGVDRVGTGHHARPADGKAIRLDAQLFQQRYILLVAVVVITGDSTVLAVLDVPLAQSIPDTGNLAVLIVGTLNLVSSTGRTPEKILRKAHLVSSFIVLQAGHTAPAELHSVLLCRG